MTNDSSSGLRGVVGQLMAVGAFILSSVGSAEAACPASYATASCKAGGSYNVCARIGTSFNCNLAQNANTTAGVGYLVWDSTYGEYSAYGVDGDGDNFCCTLANTIDLSELILSGTSQSDSTLSFYDSSTGNSVNAYGASLVTARIFGGNGNDTLYGPNLSNSWLKIILAGESEDDEIFGSPGNDIILGGPGSDNLWGLEGDDEMIGEGGTDIILGGPGSDNINGGPSSDIINGDEGTDNIIGGIGGDVLCGGGYTTLADSFDGTDGSDDICGTASGQEVGTAGAGRDRCFDSSSLVESCETTLTESYCNAICP